MQHIYGVLESNRLDCPVRLTLVVFDNFQNAGRTKPL